MRALAGALQDDEACKALEADFREFYRMDLRDMWRPGSGVSYFLVARLLVSLPKECRLYRLVADDPLSFHEQILVHLLDMEKQTAYYTAVGAAAQVGKKGWSKIAKHAPKPTPMGNKEKDKEKIPLTPAKDAAAAVSRIIKNAVAGIS